MKIAIIGAGAIGGFVGAQLAHAGEDVTFIARGATLEALKARGIRLIMSDGSEKAVPRVKATVGLLGRRTARHGDARHEGAPSRGGGRRTSRSCSGRTRSSCRCRTAFRSGISTGTGARSTGSPVHQRRSDAERSASTFPCERVIGCVVYPATELIAPGRDQADRGQPLPGRRSGWHRERARQARVGMLHPRRPASRRCSTDIRAEMWLKLWGNLTFNPISALSRATLAGICQYPPTRELARCMMTEAQAIANKLGITFRVSHREAHRGRRAGGPPQDLDAAGCRGGTHARDRCAARLGDRARRG